ncbi:MAG: hypothetical protein ACK5MF_05965 [Vibrio sp.]|uniref:hypothetical protein n=1 Tax=Vibrio sp. TaxID=678 RepID=UPI003A88AE70
MVLRKHQNIKLSLVASALAVILTGCGGDDSSNKSSGGGTTSSEVSALNSRMDAISYNVADNSDTALCENAAAASYLIETEHFNIVTETGYEVTESNAIRAAQLAEVVWQDLISAEMFDIDAANDTTITTAAWTVCLKTASDSGFKGSALDYDTLEVGYTANVAYDYPLMLHEMTHVLGDNIAYLNAVDNGQTYSTSSTTMRWIKEAMATLAASQANIFSSEIEDTFYSATGSTVVSPALINSYAESLAAGLEVESGYDGYDQYSYYATMLQAIQDQGTDFALKDWLYLYGDYDVLTDTTALATRFNNLMTQKGISFTLSDLQTANGFDTHIISYIASNYDKTVAFSADRSYIDFYIETDSIYQPDIEATATADGASILYTSKHVKDGSYKIYASTASGDAYGPATITIKNGAIAGPVDLNSLPVFTDFD